MFLKEIGYEEAVKRHPKEVDEIVAKLRRGASQHKDLPPEKLRWTYECAQKIEGSGTFQDLLSGKIAAEREAFEALSFHDKVKKTVDATTTTLRASIGRWYANELVANPPEVKEAARKRWKKQIKVDKKFAKMPETEKKAAAKEALEQLKGHHGFVSVGFQLPKAFPDSK